MGGIQGMVVLEEGQSYPSDHIQQQPVCGNQVFGIYKDRQKMMVDCKRWIGCVD